MLYANEILLYIALCLCIEDLTVHKKESFLNVVHYFIVMETITLPKAELEQLHRELETLRNSGLYKRLLEFENNIAEGKRFTRKDLGF